MNRREKRFWSHKLKRAKGLRKKKGKGGYGRPPQYIMDFRKLKEQKKLQKKSQITETKEVKDV